MENFPRRILVIDTAWIGDVIFTTSLLGAVKKTWPDALVDILVAPRGEPLVRNHPHLHRIWIYDKRGKERGIVSLLKLGRALQSEGYDLVINAHPSLRSRILAKLTDSPIRIGYEGFGSRFCHTHVVPNDLALEPDHVERRMALLRVLGEIGETSPLHVEIGQEDLVWAEKFLRNKLQTTNFKPQTQENLTQQAVSLLGLVPGSAWETKRWPEAHYRDLAARWIHERNGAVLVFGGSDDRSLVERIGGSEQRITGVVGEPLGRVGALLSKCDVVVGNDTGVTLLAVAVGSARVLALYGCTQVNYAFPEPHRAITAGVPCCLPRTGHGSNRCKWSKDGAWCMGQISVESVWREMNEKAKDNRS
jgi:heptosyltransferase-2